MERILLVEDDINLNSSVSIFLTNKGYEVEGFLEVKSALSSFEEKKYDLIISDIMLKDFDGFKFAQEIRDIDDKIPILFMTALDDISSKTKGYKAGIDDYMVKPVDLNELVLRINALLRRSGIAKTRRIVIGDFTIDKDEYSAFWREEEIPLTKREFEILFKLLTNIRKTFTRTQLLDEFWSWDSMSGPRSIDVFMTKLRSKLSMCTSFEIITVHGLGYKAIIK